MYATYEDAEWQRTAGEMIRLRRDYDALLGALANDDRAQVWLDEYAKGWPPGSGPPAEIASVQRELDRDLELPRRPPDRLLDVRESGRLDWKCQPVLEYLAVWPTAADGTEWGRTWETRLSLSTLGPVWVRSLRPEADDLETRTQGQMRRTWRDEWKVIKKRYDLEDMPEMMPILPFSLHDALVKVFGAKGWATQQHYTECNTWCYTGLPV